MTKAPSDAVPPTLFFNETGSEVNRETARIIQLECFIRWKLFVMLGILELIDNIIYHAGPLGNSLGEGNFLVSQNGLNYFFMNRKFRVTAPQFLDDGRDELRQQGIYELHQTAMMQRNITTSYSTLSELHTMEQGVGCSLLSFEVMNVVSTCKQERISCGAANDSP